MRNPEIEKKMYELAVKLIEKRYPTGWGGAAVIHTNKGHYFTSVAIETANAFRRTVHRSRRHVRGAQIQRKGDPLPLCDPRG